MKLHQTHSDVQKIGVQSEAEFGIKVTSKAFKILSDGLYSNKILAVVRELSCNAIDSHVAAGNPEPIKIHLPTTIEPWFSVEDDGVGLSHEDIMSLYTTYFDSSKDGTNDAIGAFGVGSKSPFAYANSFTVTSRFNGEERIYTAFINDNGTPSIALLSQSKTDKGNGLSVKIGVNKKDFDEFAREVQRACSRFNPIPTILNGNPIKPVKYIMRGKGWRIRDMGERNSYHYGYNSPVYAIQGGVAYPVSAHSLMNEQTSNNICELSILSCPIDIKFDIGELDVAVSREELSYDDRTIENIVNKLKLVQKDISRVVSQTIEKCPTYYNACITYHKMRDLPKDVKSLATPEWKGRKICSQLNVDTEFMPDAKISIIDYGYGKARRRNMHYTTLNSYEYYAKLYNGTQSRYEDRYDRLILKDPEKFLEAGKEFYKKYIEGKPRMMYNSQADQDIQKRTCSFDLTGEESLYVESDVNNAYSRCVEYLGDYIHGKITGKSERKNIVLIKTDHIDKIEELIPGFSFIKASDLPDIMEDTPEMLEVIPPQAKLYIHAPDAYSQVEKWRNPVKPDSISKPGMYSVIKEWEPSVKFNNEWVKHKQLISESYSFQRMHLVTLLRTFDSEFGTKLSQEKLYGVFPKYSEKMDESGWTEIFSHMKKMFIEHLVKSKKDVAVCEAVMLQRKSHLVKAPAGLPDSHFVSKIRFKDIEINKLYNDRKYSMIITLAENLIVTPKDFPLKTRRKAYDVLANHTVMLERYPLIECRENQEKVVQYVLQMDELEELREMKKSLDNGN